MNVKHDSTPAWDSVDPGIPVPNLGAGTGRPRKYHFGEMRVGDSVLVDGTLATSAGCNAYSAAKYFGHRHGWSFTGRKVAPGKVRIWRTA